MRKFFLAIYNYFLKRKAAMWTLMLALVAFFAFFGAKVSYE